MRKFDANRVVFFSKSDLSGSIHLKHAELVLRQAHQSGYTNINDVLELYNINKYLDNGLYLKTWTNEDIVNFTQKSCEYRIAIGTFMANISDNNIETLHAEIISEYLNSFWELVSTQGVFKRISNHLFEKLLTDEYSLINEILRYKKLVDHYKDVIRDILLRNPQSAEIILSIYEIEPRHLETKRHIPQNLLSEDIDNIITQYLNLESTNFNYLPLIQNSKKQGSFKISDKLRLKAKRLYKQKNEEFFANNSGEQFGISIIFSEDAEKIKEISIDKDHIVHYKYDIRFIRDNKEPYSLFQMFSILFEYVDKHCRVSLVNKENQMGIYERFVQPNPINYYNTGVAFTSSEMLSLGQLYSFSKIVEELKTSVEEILSTVYTSVLPKMYNLPSNVQFSITTATSHLEKVRILAPEFESILKQYKLFAEEREIDFELLQMSSAPSTIADIPSLNPYKYIYLNPKNDIVQICSNILFSDQRSLSYVDTFKEKQYHTFFDLISNEKVRYDAYKEYQKPELKYLIDHNLVSVDNNGFISVPNPERVHILKDLHDNEVCSFYHHSERYQKELRQMLEEDLVYSDCTLFSKPEQAYFNYYLNKKEFTNGWDLRNSYLHGTQAIPSELETHKQAYYTYLKLLTIVLLKIDNDLMISYTLKNKPYTSIINSDSIY